MKKLFSAVMLWLLAVVPMMAGITVYFDNSNTNWSNVIIHYWSPGPEWNKGPQMSLVKGQTKLYSYTLPDDISNFLFYCKDVGQTKNLSSRESGIVFRATSKDAAQENKWICETMTLEAWLSQYGSNQGDNQGGNQGGDTPSAAVSGTLPVLYINVYNADGTAYDNAIIDRNLRDKNYRAGEYWLTVPEGEEYQWMKDLKFANVGSEEEPLALEIKARGNHTRTGFSKKPFKIKLGKKADLLGLTPAKSKHYALLAHADDDKGFLRNFVGFNLGKRIGLPWTPGMQPVELVINGDYRGLYFLTESIRVGDGRIEIEELADYDPAKPTDIPLSQLSGGYLVELDNYPETPVGSYYQVTSPEKHESQIWLRECVNGKNMYINFDTPEVLRDIQKDFLIQQFTEMNNRLGNYNDQSVWSYLDLDDAARYYLVMEVCNHWESYHGSTYLYRDRGEGQKWHFAPLWDMGHAFEGPSTQYFYNNGLSMSVGGNTWVVQLNGHPEFREKVSATWQWFINNCCEGLMNDIDTYVERIRVAAANDWARWNNQPLPDYYDNANVWGGNSPTAVVNNSDMTSRRDEVKSVLNNKINWLKSQWGSADLSEPARDQTPAALLPDWAKAPELPDVEGKVSKTLPVVYIATKQPESAGTYDVYFDNSVKNWDEVHIWAWTAGGVGCLDADYEFPGQLCVNLGNNMWGWRVPDGKPAPDKIIFAIAQGNQTGDFDYEQGATYNYNGRMNVPVVAPAAPATVEIGYGDEGALGGTIVIRDLAEDANLLGSAEAPVEVEAVKGTGKAADWNAYEKKAYKVKLASKAKGGVLGMSTTGSKHWSLLPYVDDTANGLLTNYAAHLIAETVGMDWTPGMTPVEVVVDGDYKGLYFLVESIHIDDDRINSVTDYDKKAFTLGEDWIIEFDDNASDLYKHYTFGEGADIHHVTSHSPDLSLTDEQLAGAFNKNYTGPKTGAELRRALGESVDALLECTAAITGDSTEWEEMIDPMQAARYYVVQEVMDVSDAFNTSFYAYHGKGGKWMLGPVWNFSNAFASGNVKNALLHQDESFNGALIAQLWKSNKFKLYVKKIFTETYKGDETGVENQTLEYSLRRDGGEGNRFVAAVNSVTAMGEKIEAAAGYDAKRWPDYAASSEVNRVSTRVSALTSNIENNLTYLYNPVSSNGAGWYDENVTGIESITGDSDSNSGEPAYFDLTGRRVECPAAGVYIERRGSSARKVVIK